MNILDFFPFDITKKPPREQQIESLHWMAEQDARYLLLEAPTGAGKSVIGLTYAEYLRAKYNAPRSSYILTPQRVLQEQYVNSFDPSILASLYGKSNYTCHSRGTTCDVGSLFKERCAYCPHKTAIGRAVKTNNTVMNYKLGLLMFGFTSVFSKTYPRPLLILDECHTAEEHLTEFDAVIITHKRATKYGVKEWPQSNKTDIFQAQMWLNDVYLPAAQTYMHKLHHEVEPLLHEDHPTKEQVKKIREYSRMEDYVLEMGEFAGLDEERLATEYVLIFDKTSFKFKQLTGARNFHKILNPMANQVLFMSATILNKDGFCRDLGLPRDETAFLSMKSDFAPEHRPVIFLPQMRMNATWNDENRGGERKKMIEGVKKILTIHNNEKGIIHTGNFKIAEWLIEALQYWPESTHQYYHHNPNSQQDRNDVIKRFIQEKDPALLISPSITEGLDLFDELARFAIFAKVPFGYLGDQWIKRRMQMSEEWYQRRALIDIIQGGGRIVRSRNDWGHVYILDQSWQYLLSRTRSILPKYWLEAYQELK